MAKTPLSQTSQIHLSQVGAITKWDEASLYFGSLFSVFFFFLFLPISIDTIFVKMTTVVSEFFFVLFPAFEAVLHCSITPFSGMLFSQDSHSTERWVMFSELLPLLPHFL